MAILFPIRLDTQDEERVIAFSSRLRDSSQEIVLQYSLEPNTCQTSLMIDVSDILEKSAIKKLMGLCTSLSHQFENDFTYQFNKGGNTSDSKSTFDLTIHMLGWKSNTDQLSELRDIIKSNKDGGTPFLIFGKGYNLNLLNCLHINADLKVISQRKLVEINHIAEMLQLNVYHAAVEGNRNSMKMAVGSEQSEITHTDSCIEIISSFKDVVNLQKLDHRDFAYLYLP